MGHVGGGGGNDCVCCVDNNKDVTMYATTNAATPMSAMMIYVFHIMVMEQEKREWIYMLWIARCRWISVS